MITHLWVISACMSTSPDPETVRQLMQAAVTIAGSEAKLGKAAGFSQNAIWHAKSQGRVSAEMAAAIDRATGGAIAKRRLRPDLYGSEPATIGRDAA
ncbi:hypothetical protein D3C86_1181370 [compost metagenome]